MSVDWVEKLLEKVEEHRLSHAPTEESSTSQSDPTTPYVWEVPKLRSTEDFAEWQQGLQTHLSRRELLHHIIVPTEWLSRQLSPSDSATPNQEPDEQWESDDALVRHIIGFTVPDEVVKDLPGNSADMYRAICEQFRPKARADAFRDLANTRWDGDESRSDFAQRWAEASYQWLSQTDRDAAYKHQSLLFVLAIQSGYGDEGLTSIDSTQNMFDRPISELIRVFCMGGLILRKTED